MLHIEALTMLEMSKKEIIPAVSAYLKDLSGTAAAVKAVVADADLDANEHYPAGAGVTGSTEKENARYSLN